MTQPTVKTAKLNNNRYEISVENQHGVLKCFMRAKLYGDKARVDVTARET
jgi:hypothetical protein